MHKELWQGIKYLFHTEASILLCRIFNTSCQWPEATMTPRECGRAPKEERYQEKETQRGDIPHDLLLAGE